MKISTKILFSLILSGISLQCAMASIIVSEISGATTTWSEASAGGVPESISEYSDFSYFDLPWSYSPPSVATNVLAGDTSNFASADADATQNISATTSQFISSGTADSFVAYDGSYDYARASSQSYIFYEFYLTETYSYDIAGELTGGFGSFSDIILRNSDTLVSLFSLDETDAGTGAHNASGILSAGRYSIWATIDSLAGDFITHYPDTVTSSYFVQFDLAPATVVPLPASVWLFGSGLIVILGRKQKKVTKT